MDIKLHTMFVLVGPSNCGKSHFAKEFKDRLETHLDSAVNKDSDISYTPNVQLISSDALRREVIGWDLHKHDPRMMHASKAAFGLLHKKVELAMQHPTLAEFIIVDTTGLSKEFRADLAKQARENNYNMDLVVFDYKKNDMYYEYLDKDPGVSKRVIQKHIDKLRKKFWKEVDRRQTKKIHKITNRTFPDINITNLDQYAKCVLPRFEEFDIIGDVHGCIDELKALVSKLGYVLEGNKITSHSRTDKRQMILVGDVVDKGYASKEVLRFVLDNISYFKLVRGNHENFVTKWHKGKIKDSGMTDEFRIKHFDTSEVRSPDFIELLYKYDELATPFLEGNGFIVTHGPAENKFLGKLDSVSVRNQLKGKKGSEGAKDDPEITRDDFYSYIKEESAYSLPFHVFGHLTQKTPLKLESKIGIDTGCFAGGELSAVNISHGRPFYNSVPATNSAIKKEELENMFQKDKNDFEMKWLTPRENGRINWTVKDKINFISGTMSPSDTNGTDLEPLETAFDYYREKGIDKVTLQMKHMGSRCNTYIRHNLDECFAVSRRGFQIKLDMDEIYKDLQKKHLTEDAELIVLDGELEPWYALGAGLIDDYKTISAAVHSELDLLEENGFEEALSARKNKADFVGYMQESVKATKEEMRTKFGQHNVQTFKSFLDYKYVPISEHRKNIQVYDRQVELFGGEGELSFKPFNILKIVKKDGTEIIPNNNVETYSQLNNVKAVVIDLNDAMDIAAAYAFNEIVTTRDEMEGVVVKPIVNVEGVAPFLKVRNPNYLTLVYGYDYRFPHKYERLVKQKRVRRKLQASVREHEIGQAMLSTKQGDILETNEEYRKLIANMIAEEHKEEQFDPRL